MASRRSCWVRKTTVNAIVGTAASSIPRTPPSASESCLRTTCSTVCVVASVTDGSPRPQLVARVVHHPLVVLDADAALDPQDASGSDASDAPPSEPHHADRARAVVQLRLEGRHAPARTQRDGLQRALDHDALAVRRLVDRDEPGLAGVLAQLAGLVALLVRPAADRRAQTALVLRHAPSVVSRR